jgi:hypothetical protein
VYCPFPVMKRKSSLRRTAADRSHSYDASLA